MTNNLRAVQTTEKQQIYIHQGVTHTFTYGCVMYVMSHTFGDASVSANGSREMAATTHPTSGNLSLEPNALKSLKTRSSHTLSNTAGRSADREVLLTAAALTAAAGAPKVVTAAAAPLPSRPGEDGLSQLAALSVPVVVPVAIAALRFFLC